MNLTYEVKGKGYTIFNNGVAWIVQDVYIPYPGKTVAESAENHIAFILKNREDAEIADVELPILQDDSLMIAETLALALIEIEQLKEEINTIKGE